MTLGIALSRFHEMEASPTTMIVLVGEVVRSSVEVLHRPLALLSGKGRTILHNRLLLLIHLLPPCDFQFQPITVGLQTAKVGLGLGKLLLVVLD